MRTLFLGSCLLLIACPGYDRYDRITDQDGLVDADRFARYGVEQAQAIAIGRAFGAGYAGAEEEARGRQIAQAMEYIPTVPRVANAVPDTQAILISVAFRSGWRKGVLPIEDGVPADRTEGLPTRR